jgi:hypothetical protein
MGPEYVKHWPVEWLMGCMRTLITEVKKITFPNNWLLSNRLGCVDSTDFRNTDAIQPETERSVFTASD